MREVAVPPLVERHDINSTISLIKERAEHAPDHVAFHVKNDAGTRDYTLPQFFELVDRVAAGLVARGFRVGDHGAVMGATCFDWSVAEFAVWRAGGVVVPIYDTTSLERAREILSDSGARVLFIGSDIDEAFLDLEIADALDLGSWRYGEELNSAFTDPAEQTDSNDVDAELERRRLTVERSDVASLVYTSGTTGEQKGTRITHANFVDLVLNVQAAWKDVLNENGRTIIFLPLAHVLARGLQMICMWAGMRVTHMSDPKELIASLRDLKPTFLVVVPRVMEKILAAIAQRAESKKMGKLWRVAERTAREWGKVSETADELGLEASDVAGRKLRVRHALFDKLFYGKVRTLLGGEIEFLLSGAAPLNPDHSLAFRGMGVPIMEGYGLTETTAPATGNRPGRIRSGTVGEPVPGTTIKVDDDGRVLIKGIGVADGYTSAEQTDLAFGDGFFDTGDLGSLDADGYLTITGRSKDVLVTAGGKNVSPAKWEAQLEADPIISHAVMVGDNKPYLSALILLDRSELQQWAARHGHEFEEGTGELADELEASTPREILDVAVLNHIKGLVDKANTTVARSETVKSIRAIIVDATPESGLLTPTLKIKRDEAMKRFSTLIDDLYDRNKK